MLSLPEGDLRPVAEERETVPSPFSPMRASGRGAKDCCFRMSRCLPTCGVWLARLLAVGDRERRSCSPEIRA
jgi:hypothetical protein